MVKGIQKDFFNRQALLIVCLVLLGSVLLFFNLGQRALWEPDEGRYAEIAREMTESGDWLTPRLNYIKHFDKPPITYWLIALSFKIFGLHEYAAHLPLLIIGLLGILAAFFLGKEMFNQRVGFFAACILASSLGYPGLAHVLSTDIVFSFFCLLSYLFFVRKQLIPFSVSLALGFMTKGPVIFVIVLLPIYAFSFYSKQTKKLRQIPWVKGIFLFILIGLSWYLYQAQQNQGLFYVDFLQKTISRIYRHRRQPFYFFLPVLIGLFFPWIFFLIASLKGRLKFKKSAVNEEGEKLLLLFFWFALPFLFFSLIGKKLVPYILPLLPPLAVIVALFWVEGLENSRLFTQRAFTLSCRLLSATLAILSAAFIAFLCLGYPQRLNLPLAAPNIALMSLICLSAAVVILILLRQKRHLALFCAVALSSSLFLLCAVNLLPKIENEINKSVKQLALKIKQDLQPEDKVVNYRCFLNSLPFYLKRRTIVVERQRNLTYEDDPGHWKDYLLKDKSDLYRLLSSRAFKVYCITYTWEYKNIKKEYKGRIYQLGQAGKYVLFANKK